MAIPGNTSSSKNKNNVVQQRLSFKLQRCVESAEKISLAPCCTLRTFEVFCFGPLMVGLLYYTVVSLHYLSEYFLDKLGQSSVHYPNAKSV